MPRDQVTSQTAAVQRAAAVSPTPHAAVTARFTDHPTDPGVRRWKRAPWRAIGSAITLLLAVTLLVGTIVAAGIGLSAPDALANIGTGTAALFALGFLLFVVAMGAISRLLWRDLRGMLGTTITLRDDGIVLRLPPGRSLIHNPPAFTGTVPWRDVKAIETRVELYGAQGMATMSRVYRLLRVQGEPVFLFEQRGLRSNVETESMEAIAAEIAQRAGVAIRQLGTFEGQGGLLGAWGASPPAWNAKAVSLSRREVLMRRLRFTTSTVGLAVAAVWLVRALVAARGAALSP